MRRLRSARWKCEVIFDVDGKLAEIETLNAKAEDPGFWSDAEAAQKVQRRLAALRSSVETWEGLNGDVEDAAVLAEMAEDEGDEDAELSARLRDLRRDVEAVATDLERGRARHGELCRQAEELTSAADELERERKLAKQRGVA